MGAEVPLRFDQAGTTLAPSRHTTPIECISRRGMVDGFCLLLVFLLTTAKVVPGRSLPEEMMSRQLIHGFPRDWMARRAFP